MAINNSNSPRMNFESTLNDDVLMEILLRVPAKVIIRFKLVCKKWHSLFCTDQFCRLHILHHPKSPPSLILQKYTTMTSKSPPEFFYFDPFLGRKTPYSFTFPDPKILSSCNGLMMLESEHNYYVYNLTTKQSRKISIPHYDTYRKAIGFNLAFDPSKSPHYKIVCIMMRHGSFNRDRCMIEIYTSENCHWKVCFEDYTFQCNTASIDFTKGVYCNNFIYWPSFPVTPYFDIDNNSIKYFYSPEFVIPYNIIDGLSRASHNSHQELNGHLYYIKVIEYAECESLQVWRIQGQNGPRMWLSEHSDTTRAEYGVGDPLRIVIRESGKLVVCRFHKLDYVNVHQFSECLAPV